MDISSLLSSLSQEDMEKLKATARQFFGETDNVEEKKNAPSERGDTHNSQGLQGVMPFDPGMISSVAKFSGLMNENDEKSAFITALKPLLSEKRQKKADDAVMMLKFMKIINLIQENGR